MAARRCSIPSINLPFIALGYRMVGRAFAVKSAIAMGGLTLCLAVVPYPDVTPDLLLTAVFGGVFIGAGIGLAMRGGAVLDGTEIAALLLSSKTPLLKVSDVILLLNVGIFGIAVAFLGVEPALYSTLTYVAASKAVDFIVFGIEQYTGVTIISDRSEDIRRVITEELHRGVTLYRGKRGYAKSGEPSEERDIVFAVVTRLELPEAAQARSTGSTPGRSSCSTASTTRPAGCSRGARSTDPRAPRGGVDVTRP